MTDKPRACYNCARAKAKCIWRSSAADGDADSCQRCSKASLECSKVTPTGPRRKRGKGIRSKMIEQKLDNIMTLLSQERPELAATLAGMAPDTPVPNMTPRPNPNIQVPLPPPTPATAAAVPPTPSTTTVDDAAQIPDCHGITYAQADAALHYYRTELMQQFPFVAPSPRPARELHATCPLLLKAVLRVAHALTFEQEAQLESWIRQQLAHRIAVLMQRSTELLQAILVFLAWHPVQFYTTGCETSLLQLAIGLVNDLGLTKPVDSGGPKPGSIVDDALSLRDQERPRPMTHTNADRRAVLGVFFLTSSLSGFLGKAHRLEYTPYLDECCRVLAASKELDTDLLLVHMIQLRRISVKVGDLLWGRNDRVAEVQSWSTQAMAVATMQKELESVMENLPESLKSNHLLNNDCCAIRIRLLEPAIHAPSGQSDPLLLRSRLMWTCLQSAQMLLEGFFAVPIATYSTFTFVTMLQLALAMLKCIRLLCLDGDPDWDAETARRSFDLKDALRRLGENFVALNMAATPRSGICKDGQPLALLYAERCRYLMRWYMAKIESRRGGGSAAIESLDPVLGDALWMQSAEPGAEFWQDMANWDYGADVYAEGTSSSCYPIIAD